MQLFLVSRSQLQGKNETLLCDLNKEEQKHILAAMQMVIGWLGNELWKCFRGLEEKSDFLCKSERSSDGCLVLVVCYESFNAAGRRHSDLDPLFAKLRGTRTLNLSMLRFSSPANVGPFSTDSPGAVLLFGL